MIRRRVSLVVTATVALAFAAACSKKKDEAAGKADDPWAGKALGAAPGAEDPWDPKPKNADAPPPPLASKLGANAGGELAKLAAAAPAEPAAPSAAADAVAITAGEVSKAGIPTHAMRGFAGIQQSGFRVAYATSKDAQHEQFRQVFEEHKVFELVAQGLNQTIRMPHTVDIQMVDCGIINAFYDPNNSRIIVCYELLSYFVGIFTGNVASDEQLGQAVIGATLFGFYHELGHALIHQLKLPMMGREEDSADQIATLMLMEAGDDGVGMALSGAYWFNLQQKSGNETPFWDEHAFDGQRYYNILCLIYGSNPAKYQGFVDSGNLPKARAARCGEEYGKIRESFQTLIAPHLTNNTPQEIDYTSTEPVAAPTAPTPGEPTPGEPTPGEPIEPGAPTPTAPDEPGADEPGADQTAEADPFAAPEPAAPTTPHAISCEQVADKAIELIGVEAERQLGKLPEAQRAQALEEVKANLPAFLEQFLAQCGSEDWPDDDRQCVLDAATLDVAGKCGIK